MNTPGVTVNWSALGDDVRLLAGVAVLFVLLRWRPWRALLPWLRGRRG